MITALKRAYANFRGFDTTHSAVPPMDGPLRPNTRLDEAPVALVLPAVDNLTPLSADTNEIACSSGAKLLILAPKVSAKKDTQKLKIVRKQEFSSEISCIASDGHGALAIGLDSGGIVLQGGDHDGKKIEEIAGSKLGCPTAALFLTADTLLVANGSADYSPLNWKADLMSKNCSGSLWMIDLTAPLTSTNPHQIMNNLAFPTGIALRENAGIFVSEAWKHRILSADIDGQNQQIVLGELPAYPGRIFKSDNGGYWFALFAPRNPLVEFVLLEDKYRMQMLETIHPDHWIAPNLQAGRTFLEPIQGGARKMLNRLKPWSPSWSYGLIARCDSDMRPLESLHSRADGAVHGITSLCGVNGTLFAGAKGSGIIVAIEQNNAKGDAQ